MGVEIAGEGGNSTFWTELYTPRRQTVEPHPNSSKSLHGYCGWMWLVKSAVRWKWCQCGHFSERINSFDQQKRHHPNESISNHEIERLPCFKTTRKATQFTKNSSVSIPLSPSMSIRRKAAMIPVRSNNRYCSRASCSFSLKPEKRTQRVVGGCVDGSVDVSMCWSADVLVDAWMCWCVDALMCW